MLLPSGSKRTAWDTPDWVAFPTTDPVADAGRKESKKSDFEKLSPEEPFINLSSTAAFVRRLFALSEVIAAI